MREKQLWKPDRPHVLVIACSDGRFQEQLDSFLGSKLKITSYDRLYVAGGPGALATSSFDYRRSDVVRGECRFLIEAHQIQEAILLFHSGSAEGPDVAMCADYLRKFPSYSISQLRAQQESDARDLLSDFLSWPPELNVRVYRAETHPSMEVEFVPLAERLRG